MKESSMSSKNCLVLNADGLNAHSEIALADEIIQSSSKKKHYIKPDQSTVTIINFSVCSME